MIMDLEFIENSAEELYEGTVEFLDNLNGEKNFSSLQIEFNQFIKKMHIDLFNQRNINGHRMIDQQDCLKMVRLFKSSNGALCNSYLKKI